MVFARTPLMCTREGGINEHAVVGVSITQGGGWFDGVTLEEPAVS